MHSSIRTSSSLAALFSIASLRHVYAQQLNTMCWYKTDNNKHSSLGGPCGVITPNSNYTSCCAIGDTCVENGICHYTHAKPLQGYVTGYYVGGCNDPNLSPSNCNMHCSSFDNTDIVYNSTTNTWACCGVTNGVIHCDEPTSEAFSAPAPAAMVATYTVQSAVSTAAATSTSSTRSSAPTKSGDGEKYIPKPLSAGAQAGIGVGVSIGGLAIIALAFWYWRRRSQRAQYAATSTGEPKEGSYADARTPGAVGRGSAATGPPGYKPNSAQPYNGGETAMGGTVGGVGKGHVGHGQMPAVEKFSEREGHAAGTQELDSATVASAGRGRERYELP